MGEPHLPPKVVRLLAALADIADAKAPADPDDGRRALYVRDVARLRGISTSAVRELVRRGALPMRKPPGTDRYEIMVKDYEAWTRGQPPAAGESAA